MIKDPKELLLPIPVSSDFFTLPEVDASLKKFYYAIRRCLLESCQSKSSVHIDDLFEDIVSNDRVMSEVHKIQIHAHLRIAFIAKHAQILITELQRLVHEQLTYAYTHSTEE